MKQMKISKFYENRLKELSHESLFKFTLGMMLYWDKKEPNVIRGKLGYHLHEEREKKSRKEEYEEELKHPLWIRKRDEMLKHYDYECALCGSKDNLQVHHIKYIEDLKAWQYPNKTLVVLCGDCHMKVHDDPEHELNPYKKH